MLVATEPWPALSRLAWIGWVCGFVASGGAAAAAGVARVRRHVLICASESAEPSRDWVFTLLPLSQTCPGRPPLLPLVIAWPLGVAVMIAALCSLAVGVVLICTRFKMTIPTPAFWYLVGLISGIVLSAVVVWARRGYASTELEHVVFVISGCLLLTLSVAGGVAVLKHLITLGRHGH